jgi:hypothetical protein
MKFNTIDKAGLAPALLFLNGVYLGTGITRS